MTEVKVKFEEESQGDVDMEDGLDKLTLEDAKMEGGGDLEGGQEKKHPLKKVKVEHVQTD